NRAEGVVVRPNLLRRLAGGGIQDQNVRPRLCQIQHVVECASKLIGRLRSDSSQSKVVFYEAEDRSLIGQSVIHEVCLGERRDHQQRQARPITAAASDSTSVGGTGVTRSG